MEES
jgi:hypothetical protein